MRLISERQLTFGPLNKDLDNNRNFSPDGRRLVFDCRDDRGLPFCARLGMVDTEAGAIDLFYTMPGALQGVGAASFLNHREVVALHALLTGIPYDFTLRGGMIIPAGGGRPRWLDSRNGLPPFTPGALRGGTHKHEPDFTGEWIGFTYNDHWMKTRRGSDLRNVGVSRRGHQVFVPDSPENFAGESFTVLLTSCTDHPKPGSDEIRRAEGDCWVGVDGYRKEGGHQRARAFRGTVCVQDGSRLAYIQDVFLVDVPDDLTVAGPGGPLEGTEFAYPSPPQGAATRRLTHTAAERNPVLRGVSGHCRATGDGRWIGYVAKVVRGSEIEGQVFAVSPETGRIRQITRIDGGIAGDPRFSEDGRFVAVSLPDGGVAVVSAVEGSGGEVLLRTPPHREEASRIVISPDSSRIAFNRLAEGTMQIFLVETGAIPG